MLDSHWCDKRTSKLRRDTSTAHLKRICEEPKADCKELFGDDNKMKLAEIKADNELKEQFKKKPPSSTPTGKEKASTKGYNRYKTYGNE